MEFMNRSNRSNPVASSPTSTPPAATNGSNGINKKVKGMMGLKLAYVALLFSATILVVAVLWFVVLGAPSSEAKHVEDDKMQAVFLNGGQVYFGQIEDLNDDFMRMIDIYYLRVNQTVQPDQQQNTTANDISLVKLGCELHGPKDEMVINRDQVVFWENLKTDGQVAKAVDKYKQDNPNGQKCENNTQSNTNTNTNTTTPTTNPANNNNDDNDR